MQIDLFNQELVQEKNGELLVSSITIAENIDLLHDSIIKIYFEKGISIIPNASNSFFIKVK